MNPYSVLGISKDCDIGDIKRAYRKLSLQFHPDRNQSDEAKIRILEINEAHERIGDVESRKKYDEMEYTKEYGDITELADIIQMMYTLARSNIKPSIPPPSTIPTFTSNNTFLQETSIKVPVINTSILISMKQSYYGCTIPLKIQKQKMMKYEMEIIYVTLEPGIKDNDIIILKNRGNIVDRYHIGDIEIKINIQNLSNYKRIGNDLLYKKNISLKESLCGFIFELEHINGKNIIINNMNKQNIIYPNYRKIIPNLGMKQDLEIGNLIIEFTIDFPTILSNDQIEILQNLL